MKNDEKNKTTSLEGHVINPSSLSIKPSLEQMMREAGIPILEKIMFHRKQRGNAIDMGYRRHI